ncbi:MAG: hypothetical protein JO287_03480 [Pseudonocardiales bacterium]|nr:hypothetical protein [Pseudonocardiales bacterium]
MDTGNNNGAQVIDIQRGTVDLVGPGTLTIHSTDGFSATCTVDSSTKIRKNRVSNDISQVATNDRVTVVAIKAGDTVTVQHINDPDLLTNYRPGNYVVILNGGNLFIAIQRCTPLR